MYSIACINGVIACWSVQVSNRYLTMLKDSHPDYPYVKEYLEKVCVVDLMCAARLCVSVVWCMCVSVVASSKFVFLCIKDTPMPPFCCVCIRTALASSKSN